MSTTMTRSKKKLMALAACLLAAAVFGCQNELSKSASTVLLTVSSEPVNEQIDLEPGAANCGDTTTPTLSTSTITAMAVSPNTPTGPLQQVRLTAYRATWIRVDGGTVAPPPVTRSMSLLLDVGGSSNTYTFHLSDFGQVYNQAPFVSLRPENGGVDPQTGQRRVKFRIAFELFGETLAGEKVYATTSTPHDFCYACGGCRR